MENFRDCVFVDLCRKQKWKCTPQRQAVYDFLKGNPGHPDVDEVWREARKKVPTVTRESVYRILNEFSEKGIIRRLDRIDNARYDSRTEPHGHFLCEKCGIMTDFPWPEGPVIPQELRRKSFVHMEIRLVGICDRCMGREKGTSPEEGKQEERIPPLVILK